MSKGLTALFLLLIIGCKNKEVASLHLDEHQNLMVAFAFPMNEVDIDGNPADWPEDMTKHPITAVLENQIESTEDLDAYFKVGFSEESKAIYVLLTVTDEAHRINSEKGTLSDEQDQCLMYLDKAHDAKGSGVNVYCFNALYKEIDDASTNWDPTAKNPNWDNITVASQRVDNQTYYEIEINFEKGVQEGQVVGLDFMIYDSDGKGEENELTRIAWQKTEGKEKVPFKIGSVILAKEKEQLGVVEGQFKWNQDSLGVPPKKVRITSTKIPSLWVRETVDSTGNYSSLLPKGSYHIKPEWNFHVKDEARFKLNPSGTTVDVKPNTLVNAASLELSIAEPLNLIKSEGILIENPTNKYELVDAFVASYMEYYEIPGVSLGLIENGKLTYHKTYGVKNVFTQASVEKETLFEAASITKPVFGFAVCRLAERGIIDLDQPLYTYLPFEEIAYDERYKKITARHVLSHQTGFPNWRDGEMKIEFEPGTQFGYSGEGFEYLKKVIVFFKVKILKA
ncbi:MAG: serine hydrolase [Bacteroidota bacterium]